VSFVSGRNGSRSRDTKKLPNNEKKEEILSFEEHTVHVKSWRLLLEPVSCDADSELLSEVWIRNSFLDRKCYTTYWMRMLIRIQLST
jgi:hypothetical protein